MDTGILENLKFVLMKPSRTRTYDDILFLRSFLNATDFFKKQVGEASPTLLDELYRNANLEVFADGDEVFHQGDHGDRLYIVLTGEVEIKAKQEIEIGNKMEYKERVFTIVTSGQYFGERSLLYSELRSATATCINGACNIMSIAKESYLATIQSVKNADDIDDDNEVISKSEHGTKSHVIKILGKSRHRRTSEEISIVAEYLGNRVPFFQKFDVLQRQEICRVLDVITVSGRTLLFRQGSYGQGFYIIITGTVDVYSKSGHEKTNNLFCRNDLSPSPQKSMNVLEGLGDRVNQLKPGDVFGERALESESSLRIGSVVTNEDITQLVVITKEDFLPLVSFIMQSDVMEKIAVLRKTSLFHNVEGIHLRALAKCMYPRIISIDSCLYEAGKNLEMMSITRRGELRAEIEVEPTFSGYPMPKSASLKRLKGKQYVDLGRIAPYSVLGKNICLCQNTHDNKIATETITATTLVEYYSLSKVDFLAHLPSESRQVIARVVQLCQLPIIPELWDNGLTVLNDDDWKMRKAWEKYRQDLVIKDKSSSDLLKNFRAMKHVHLKSVVSTSDTYNRSLSENNDHYLHRMDSADSMTISNRLNNANTASVGLDWGTEAAIIRDREARIEKAFEKTSTMKPQEIHVNPSSSDDHDVAKAIHRGIERDRFRCQIQHSVEFNDTVVNTVSKGAGALLLSPAATQHLIIKPDNTDNDKTYNNKNSIIHPIETSSSSTTIQLFPFSLIQYHREIGKSIGSCTMRRMAQSHVRLCGAINTCHDAKELAHLIVKNAHLTMFQYNQNDEELKLNWRAFHGFDSLPMQNTDHFLIYCKNIPVEYASFSPNKSFRNHDFPSACKAFGQRFGCILTKPLPSTNAHQLSSSSDILGRSDSISIDTSSATPSRVAEQTLSKNKSQSTSVSTMAANKPLIPSLEISSIVELVAVAVTQYDCLRFALLDNTTDNHISTSHNHNHQHNDVIIRGKKLLVSRLQQQPSLHMNIFPLFEWVVIDQQCLEMSLAQKTSMISSNEYGNNNTMTIEVKLSKSLRMIDDQIPCESDDLKDSLKESGLLNPKNQLHKFSKVMESFEKPTTYATNTKTLKMLGRELVRKDLSNKVIAHNNTISDTLSQYNYSDDGINTNNSIASNDSLSSYYHRLLVPRQDDMGIARSRLQNLKALTEARSKLLNMNETICNAENTLMQAYRYSSYEGSSLSSIKFKKLNALNHSKNSPRHHDNDDSPRTSINTSHHQPSSFRSSSSHDMASIVRNKSTFIVPEKILRTIEHSIKGKESKVQSLQKELGLGLGLIKRRSEMYDSLLHAPSLIALSQQRESEEVASAIRDTVPPPPTVKISRLNLRDKIHTLEDMLKTTSAAQ